MSRIIGAVVVVGALTMIFAEVAGAVAGIIAGAAAIVALMAVLLSTLGIAMTARVMQIAPLDRFSTGLVS